MRPLGHAQSTGRETERREGVEATPRQASISCSPDGKKCSDRGGDVAQAGRHRKRCVQFVEGNRKQEVIPITRQSWAFNSSVKSIDSKWVLNRRETSVIDAHGAKRYCHSCL
jgi:hypothetical protein